MVLYMPCSTRDAPQVKGKYASTNKQVAFTCEAQPNSAMTDKEE